MDAWKTDPFIFGAYFHPFRGELLLLVSGKIYTIKNQDALMEYWTTVFLVF